MQAGEPTTAKEWSRPSAALAAFVASGEMTMQRTENTAALLGRVAMSLLSVSVKIIFPVFESSAISRVARPRSAMWRTTRSSSGICWASRKRRNSSASALVETVAASRIRNRSARARSMPLHARAHVPLPRWRSCRAGSGLSRLICKVTRSSGNERSVSRGCPHVPTAPTTTDDDSLDALPGGLACRAQDDAVQCLASRDKAPERDEQLACQRDNHRLARA